MKKILFMSAVATAMIFSSCSKEEGVSIDVRKTQLSIKLSGVVTTKAIEDQGDTSPGTIQLNNGYVFVLDLSDAVIHKEPLKVNEAKAEPGQRLLEKVATDSRVYIIGNIPEGFDPSGLSNLAGIKAAESAITTQTQYTEVALANSDGVPAAFNTSADATTATVTVSIKPLISRIELVKVSGMENIKSFKVTGVYVDSYMPNFTYGGTGTGTVHEQMQSTDFTNLISFYKNEESFTAGGTPITAAPADSKVWAYNVASGGLPRLIIRLEGITYEKSGVLIDVSSNTYFLTVTGYEGNLTMFERGKIYRLGGANGIVFNDENLASNPNTTDVSLMVRVEINEWDLVEPGVIL